MSKPYSQAFILAEEVIRNGENFQWSRIKLLLFDGTSNSEIRENCKAVLPRNHSF